MSTAGLGEGWAATHMAAIKAVSMRDADAEIYRYIYIKKKKTEFIERARCLLCALTDTWTSRLMLLSPPVRTWCREEKTFWFWGRSTGIPRLSTTIAGTHRSSSSRQEQKAAPPCWLSTVQFQSRQKWKKQSVCVRLSLRVRIVCSLFLRVLGPVEKKIRWWFYRVPQCGGVWEWLCVGLRIWKKHICWSDERQEELTLEPFVVGRYGSKIKSRYMSFNFRVTTEYIAKVPWRFN